MRIDERMRKNIKTCRQDDSLASAARLLWEHDCGCVPVIDERGHVEGMLTDRDICMAAYTSGRTLNDLQVGSAMARDIATVQSTETVREAELMMRSRGVRRLPVVDGQNRLLGLVTLNDICRWVTDGGANGHTQDSAAHLLGTLAAVGKPRTPANPARERVAESLRRAGDVVPMPRTSPMMRPGH